MVKDIFLSLFSVFLLFSLSALYLIRNNGGYILLSDERNFMFSLIF